MASDFVSALGTHFRSRNIFQSLHCYTNIFFIKLYLICTCYHNKLKKYQFLFFYYINLHYLNKIAFNPRYNGIYSFKKYYYINIKKIIYSYFLKTFFTLFNKCAT